MRELLSFCASELRESRLADISTECTFHFGWFFNRCFNRDALFVLGHCNKFNVRFAIPFKTHFSRDTVFPFRVKRKFVKTKGFGEFSGSIASEVIENNGISVSDTRQWIAVTSNNDTRTHKFIAFAVGIIRVLIVVVIGICSGSHRVADTFSEEAVCHCNAFPSVIPIHCVITSDNGGYLPDTDLFQFRFNLFTELDTEVGLAVAAIAEIVNQDLVGFESICLGKPEQSIEVFKRAMHASIACQPHEMEMCSVLFDMGNRFQKHFVLSKFTGTDHRADAEEFLVHNASCADILMSDFAVADNTGG